MGSNEIIIFFILELKKINVYLLLRDRETQNPKQAPGSEQAVSTEPHAGLELMNSEIMT